MLVNVTITENGILERFIGKMFNLYSPEKISNTRKFEGSV